MFGIFFIIQVIDSVTVIKSFFVLNEKKTPENRKKERLIEKLFLPVGLKCRKTWEYHFGIMDVDETMVLGELVIY